MLTYFRYRGEFSAFDRHYDIGEARRIGFAERVDPVEGYKIAFERMREANIIPKVGEHVS